MTSSDRPSVHALLIGIDNYSTRSPQGCVNGVLGLDAVLSRIPGASVRRVISPLRGSAVTRKPGDRTASIANLLAALAELRANVRAGERVFIYFSGHSARVRFENQQARVYFREGWLPDNFDAAARLQIIFDFHLNEFLGQLAAVTPCVTMVIDSCYSAGATRSPPDERLVPLSRVIEAANCIDPSADGLRNGLGRGVDDCNVVAACLAHEAAHEGGVAGSRIGVFTHALVEALRGVRDDDLLDVRWTRIWHGICDDVLARTGTQHPWMSDRAARAVFGDAPVNGDAGFAVLRTSPSEYVIRAGSLAGVTAGARIAVYGDQPARFPPVGSRADVDARGTRILEVTCSGRSTAIARPVAESFEPPPGARARVIAAGAAARLGCCVVPHDEQLAALIAASPLLEVVDAHSAEVRIEKQDDVWAILDDVHGSPELRHPLVTFTAREHARPLLEHYTRYALPLRMATRCSDLPDALDLALLAVPDNLRMVESQEANLSELACTTTKLYRLRTGSKLCVRVHNRSEDQLLVTVLNCAASGRVERLGEQSIAPASFHTFWADSSIGKAFAPRIRDRRRQILDRMVAIGRTAMEADLGYLTVGGGFAEALQTTRQGVQVSRSLAEPVERWTAVATRLLISAAT